MADARRARRAKRRHAPMSKNHWSYFEVDTSQSLLISLRLSFAKRMKKRLCTSVLLLDFGTSFGIVICVRRRPGSRCWGAG